MNKYEQLIEHIINDESDKARELFHNIVVEKSRDIYESLIDESDLEETVGGNQVEDLVDEVTIDEQGISEEEDMDVMDMDSEEDSDMDFDDSGDLDAHEEEHGDVEDRVEDLESALDELKAEFDALMAGEAAEEEQFPGIHGDDNGEEVDMNMMEAEEDEDEEEELDETIVREYVEKVSAPSNTEGADNKTSIVAKANNMGGTSANIVKGGTENGAGKVSPKGKLPHADQYENVPGAKAGNAFAKKQSAKTKEEGGVDKHSPLAK
jgi:iron-sulfur cluster repair protein YtfE (RIC family)